MATICSAWRNRSLHVSPPDGRSTRKKAVIRVSCLVIRENHERGPGSLQKKSSDGPLTHFASPHGEKCRLEANIARAVDNDALIRRIFQAGRAAVERCATAAASFSAPCSLPIHCGGPVANDVGKRVIVLGIDGMDPKFLERHWDQLTESRPPAPRGGFQAVGDDDSPAESRCLVER